MEPITLTEREYVTLVAGYTPDDEEIREFLAEYEDWLLGNQIKSGIKSRIKSGIKSGVK